MASKDDVNSNSSDCCKSITGTRNRNVAQEERITSAEAAVARVVDSPADIELREDSKLKARLYPHVEENDCKSAYVDVDLEQGVARAANLKTEARISSPSSLSTITTSYPDSNCKMNHAVGSRNNGNRSENGDDSSSSDSDSSSKEQENILRTTPGAFAINNPLSSSSSDLPLLEQRPSLRNFTSSVLLAAAAASESINRSEEGIILENNSNKSVEGSDQTQDLEDDLADPETTTASVVVAASATPCLSAIRVGSEFEVYEGEIVREETDEKVDTSPSKRKTKYFACFVIWVAVAVVLVVLFSTHEQRMDASKSNNFGNAEHSHTQGTIDNNNTGSIHSPSGVFLNSNPDPGSKRLRDYLLSLLGPLSGPAGARVFDRSGKDTSLDRISALTWLVDDLAGEVVFDESSSSPSVSIPEWKIFQRYVLAVLYFATAGEGWDIQSNFLSKEHECSWSEATPLEWVSKDPILDSSNDVIGVSCNEDGRVQGLKLRK